MIAQGDIWWAELDGPLSSGPGFRRPVVVVQGDAFNRSAIATVVCIPLMINLRWAEAPGNAVITSRDTGLTKDSVANVSEPVTPDRSLLTERVGRLDRSGVALILAGIDVVLGRQ